MNGYDPPPDAGAAITMVKDCEPVADVASVTVTVKVELAATEGVPEITPPLLMLNPVGSEPDVTA